MKWLTLQVKEIEIRQDLIHQYSRCKTLSTQGSRLFRSLCILIVILMIYIISFHEILLTKVITLYAVNQRKNGTEIICLGPYEKDLTVQYSLYSLYFYTV